MILIERTHWPLVVVGSVPDASGDVPGATSEAGGDHAGLWTRSGDLRILLIVAGFGARARENHGRLFEWLCLHRGVLTARALRFAWVIEDETLRACTDMWQALFGQTLFGVESATFRRVRPSLRWLISGDSAGDPPRPEFHFETESQKGLDRPERSVLHSLAILRLNLTGAAAGSVLVSGKNR